MAIATTPPKNKNAGRPRAKTLGTRVKSKDIVFFFTQLSMMLEVGISISRAIETIAGQIIHVRFKQILLTMVEDLEAGQQLSQAMEAHAQVFKPVYINIIKSGESGGFLIRALASIIEIQEKNQGVFSQLKTALIYPALLCALAVVVVIFVLVGILPKLMVLFEGKYEILPGSTRLLMGLSRILQDDWWAVILGAAGIIWALRAYLLSQRGRSHIDWLVIHIPLISRVSNNIYTGLFLRILGNMLDSGVPLKEALSISARSMTNRYYQVFVENIADHIEQGRTFFTGFSENSHIPESIKQMIFIGEEVGKLPPVMIRVARFYEIEIEQDFKRLTALIEPVALMAMGVVVWIIVSAVILPMFRLASTIN
nr:type II secretion system F family protein [uncultured Desulfobacter sp.]